MKKSFGGVPAWETLRKLVKFLRYNHLFGAMSEPLLGAILKALQDPPNFFSSAVSGQIRSTCFKSEIFSKMHSLVRSYICNMFFVWSTLASLEHLWYWTKKNQKIQKFQEKQFKNSVNQNMPPSSLSAKQTSLINCIKMEITKCSKVKRRKVNHGLNASMHFIAFFVFVLFSILWLHQLNYLIINFFTMFERLISVFSNYTFFLT